MPMYLLGFTRLRAWAEVGVEHRPDSGKAHS